MRIIIVSIFLLSFLFTVKSVAYFKIRARFLKVIDGETIVVVYRDRESLVKLLGIDSPELRRSEKAYWDAKYCGKSVKEITLLGKRAKQFIKHLLKKNNIIYIEFDVIERDRFDSLLCYVYLRDGRMLNELIVRAGYAYVIINHPNIKHKDLLDKAYRHAVKRRVGLWAPTP